MSERKNGNLALNGIIHRALVCKDKKATTKD